jgi:hypothetical protein
VLDLGGDIGALVVYAPEALLGEEIEIRPHGGRWAGLHTAVRARHLGDAVLYAGVFGSLRAGLYDLRVRSAPAYGDAHHHHDHHDHDDHHVHGAPAESSGATPTVAVAPGGVAEFTLGDDR